MRWNPVQAGFRTSSCMVCGFLLPEHSIVGSKIGVAAFSDAQDTAQAANRKEAIRMCFFGRFKRRIFPLLLRI